MIRPYFEEFKYLIDNIRVFGPKRKVVDLDLAVRKIVSALTECRRLNNTVFFVGNGGSASIASHMATDFIKNGKMRCLAFNDGSLLTCLSNDLGYENVFSTPIKQFIEKKDILFAISSSGRSANILNSVNAARKKRCFIVTLSGFLKENPLSHKGDINFYVNSKVYSHVEILHLSICHYISDMVLEQRR
jgi:D-sedoheptulose 7-phosphate isomerase